MADRRCLAIQVIPEFKEWLINDGWELCSTKGEYEILRAKKGKRWLIVFSRINAKKHYSVRDCDMGVVRQFIRYRHERNK